MTVGLTIAIKRVVDLEQALSTACGDLQAVLELESSTAGETARAANAGSGVDLATRAPSVTASDDSFPPGGKIEEVLDQSVTYESHSVAASQPPQTANTFMAEIGQRARDQQRARNWAAARDASYCVACGGHHSYSCEVGLSLIHADLLRLDQQGQWVWYRSVDYDAFQPVRTHGQVVEQVFALAKEDPEYYWLLAEFLQAAYYA